MWILLSFINAIGLSLEGVFQKKSIMDINPYIITWSLLVVSSLIYLPLLLIVGFPKSLNSTFWIAVIARLIIDSIALVVYLKALKQSNLSTAMPMMSLIPVFLIFVSFFINHLIPSVLGIVGVLIIVLGIYLLNINSDKIFLSPFIALKKEKGIQLMLIATFLWSFVGSLQKLAIDNANVYFYTAFFQILWATFFTPIAYFSNKKEFKSMFKKSNISKLLPIGILDVIQVVAQNIAFTKAIPVYVFAIGSTNMLFSAFFGKYFFKEKLENKLLPIIIIIIGVIIISAAG